MPQQPLVIPKGSLIAVNLPLFMPLYLALGWTATTNKTGDTVLTPPATSIPDTLASHGKAINSASVKLQALEIRDMTSKLAGKQ